MSINKKVVNDLLNASWIRKMFEESISLKKRYGVDNIFDFTLGNPDIAQSETFKETLVDMAKSSSNGDHSYMPNAGYDDLREICAEYISKNGYAISGESVIITCGAAAALNVIFRTLLEPGDEVIILKPFFVEYRFYTENSYGIPIYVDTNSDFSINVEAIEKAITDRTKAIMINSPNNPTGAVYSKKEIDSLARTLNDQAKRGRTIYLISDEVYRRIVFDGITIPNIFEAYRNSIVIDSFSKSHSIPGERIGYLAVNHLAEDHDLIMDGAIMLQRTLGFINAPAFMQRVLMKCIHSVCDHVQYQKRRDILYGGLKTVGYDLCLPQGSFYMFVKSPLAEEQVFIRELLDHRILAVPGCGFGQSGYFRLAFCMTKEKIERSLVGFKKAIEKYR